MLTSRSISLMLTASPDSTTTMDWTFLSAKTKSNSYYTKLSSALRPSSSARFVTGSGRSPKKDSFACQRLIPRCSPSTWAFSTTGKST